MSNGLDFNQLVVRMGKVKLLDLDHGYSILATLNGVTGESSFKIEMTGEEIKAIYDALPSTLRTMIDEHKVLDSSATIETINDIEKSLRHMADIEIRDVKAVESYIAILATVAVIVVAVITIAYNSYTSDLPKTYEHRIANALTVLVESIYTKTNAIVPTEETQNIDTGAP